MTSSELMAAVSTGSCGKVPHHCWEMHSGQEIDSVIPGEQAS